MRKKNKTQNLWCTYLKQFIFSFQSFRMKTNVCFLCTDHVLFQTLFYKREFGVIVLVFIVIPGVLKVLQYMIKLGFFYYMIKWLSLWFEKICGMVIQIISHFTFNSDLKMWGFLLYYLDLLEKWSRIFFFQQSNHFCNLNEK